MWRESCSRGRAATPIAFIRAIVTAYRRRGMDPASALAQAQILPELLDDPAARVTAAQMELLSGLAMQELDDEALGAGLPALGAAGAPLAVPVPAMPEGEQAPIIADRA